MTKLFFANNFFIFYYFFSSSSFFKFFQKKQNLNEVMTSGGATYNGYHSAGDSNGSQWDSNGIQRGRRSIDMARPLLGSEEENEAGGR